jgi:hypothetical protein
MLAPSHLRSLVIVPALAPLPEPMRVGGSVELLVGTAIKESMLTYLKQGYRTPHDARGVALGLFQMEPDTHDTMRIYVDIRPSLKAIIAPNGPRPHADLVTDLLYAARMARLRYWIVPHDLPDAADVQGLARYWSRFYNTRNDPKEEAAWVRLYHQYAGVGV